METPERNHADIQPQEIEQEKSQLEYLLSNMETLFGDLSARLKVTVDPNQARQMVEQGAYSKAKQAIDVPHLPAETVIELFEGKLREKPDALGADMAAIHELWSRTEKFASSRKRHGLPELPAQQLNIARVALNDRNQFKAGVDGEQAFRQVRINCADGRVVYANILLCYLPVKTPDGVDTNLVDTYVSRLDYFKRNEWEERTARGRSETLRTSQDVEKLLSRFSTFAQKQVQEVAEFFLANFSKEQLRGTLPLIESQPPEEEWDKIQLETKSGWMSFICNNGVLRFPSSIYKNKTTGEILLLLQQEL